mmetsp:Transcript_126198/g.218624  ORF Transcript_126198/g.218624 Transcript_126198/m.218624 type:complete len:257 (+) Transcript_126198:779-1549(+)
MRAAYSPISQARLNQPWPSPSTLPGHHIHLLMTQCNLQRQPLPQNSGWPSLGRSLQSRTSTSLWSRSTYSTFQPASTRTKPRYHRRINFWGPSTLCRRSSARPFARPRRMTKSCSCCKTNRLCAARSMKNTSSVSPPLPLLAPCTKQGRGTRPNSAARFHSVTQHSPRSILPCPRSIPRLPVLPQALNPGELARGKVRVWILCTQIGHRCSPHLILKTVSMHEIHCCSEVLLCAAKWCSPIMAFLTDCTSPSTYLK